MSIEPKTQSHPSSSHDSRDASAWRKFLTWADGIERAMDTSYDDIQDRRILRLEREVASLKVTLDATAAQVPPSPQGSSTSNA